MVLEKRGQACPGKERNMFAYTTTKLNISRLDSIMCVLPESTGIGNGNMRAFKMSGDSCIVGKRRPGWQ